jgi:hypothetical protein
MRFRIWDNGGMRMPREALKTFWRFIWVRICWEFIKWLWNHPGKASTVLGVAFASLAVWSSRIATTWDSSNLAVKFTIILMVPCGLGSLGISWAVGLGEMAIT